MVVTMTAEDVGEIPTLRCQGKEIIGSSREGMEHVP